MKPVLVLAKVAALAAAPLMNLAVTIPLNCAVSLQCACFETELPLPAVPCATREYVPIQVIVATQLVVIAMNAREGTVCRSPLDRLSLSVPPSRALERQVVGVKTRPAPTARAMFLDVVA
jgi:hypothetical protein